MTWTWHSALMIPVAAIVGFLYNTWASTLGSSGDPSIVLTYGLGYQYLSGLLIGMGVGGVVGASTMGVALFSLIAPEGHLREFTAMVPVVNCVGNIATVSVYLKHADWQLCKSMWPFILLGIMIGTLLLSAGSCAPDKASAPSFSHLAMWETECEVGRTWVLLLKESFMKRTTSVVYGCVLAQRLYERAMEIRAARKTRHDVAECSDGTVERRAAFYKQVWVSAAVSILCGVVTVVTNNSGPIFNIYLLACGLDMNQFVATRSVMMAGKNVAKAGARMATGGISGAVIMHGLQVGLLTIVGIQIAKPIKARTSPEFYTYFTWCVLLYACVKMW